MKTTTNNNGTNNLQTINLEDNVKFSEIPAIYNFENFSIFVEKKQTGAVHGEKTLYFGTITNNENGTTTTMEGFDITKIKKIVGCNFKRVYISNADGATIPKCKELTDEMMRNMVESYYIKISKSAYNFVKDIEMHFNKQEVRNIEDVLQNYKLEAKQAYLEKLQEEQLRISIENKEKEQKRQAKQATKEAKNIDTTTEEGVIQAQIIQAMMAGDFATLAELTNKLQKIQSK